MTPKPSPQEERARPGPVREDGVSPSGARRTGGERNEAPRADDAPLETFEQPTSSEGEVQPGGRAEPQARDVP